jgi:hypothetical protein
MAGTSSYPGGLDNFAAASPTNLGDDDATGRTHSERHDDLEAAMEAVQAELGTDPAGSETTVKARFDGLDSALAGKSPSSVLYLSGTSGNYVSAPDVAALDVTGDIDIRVRVAMNDWTPAVTAALVSKFAASGNYSFELRIQATTGLPILDWSANGTATNATPATTAPTVSDGQAIWLRATLDVDNGAGGKAVTFYTAADSETVPTSWTQLGTTVTTAGTTSIFAGTQFLGLGIRSTDTFPLAGRLHRVQILNGIGGTVVADYRSDVPAARYVDGYGNTWTVNGTANGFEVA